MSELTNRLIHSSPDCLTMHRALRRGFMVSTNISKSVSKSPVYVKSVMKGKGDPGYLLTASTLILSLSPCDRFLPHM